ncbi:O-antigen ligase family protein, partial [Candidatus Falkowbacteria bacterium]|nr:O-antigen ligase family protein [Candidatus Falkowbacteria bacterium]
AILLLIILLVLAKHKWEKIFLWISLPVILAGLFFTFSKSAFLAITISIIFLAFFIFLSPEKKDKEIFIKIVLTCFVTLSILTIIYNDPVITRLKGETRLEVKSTQERIMYFEETKKLLEKYWLTGVGLGNFVPADYEQSEIKLPIYIYQPVHNVFFLAVVELGIWGFIVLALIIAEACRRIYNYKIDYNLSLIEVFGKFKIKENYYTYREKFFWFLGTTAAFFAILIIMIFDHYLWTLYFGIILWWLCLGLWLKQIFR